MERKATLPGCGEGVTLGGEKAAELKIMRNAPAAIHAAAATAVLACALTLGASPSRGQPRQPKTPPSQSSQSQAQPQQPLDAKEVALLVRQLGSPEYRLRELATKRLGEGGLEGVAPVAAAADGGELEVAIRSIAVLQQLAISEDAQTADAASAALRELRRSGNRSVSWRAERAMEFTRQWAELAIKAMGGHVSTESGTDGKAVVQIKLDGLPERKLTALQRRALKRFDVLVISGGKVKDDDVTFVGELTGLEHLDLRYTQVGDAALARLAPLVELRKLMLSGTQVSDTGLKTVGKMPKLQALYLSGTEVGDAGLAHLTGLGRIEELNLSQCKRVSDAGCASLAAMTSLRQLNLTGTQIGDKGLMQLAALRHLTGLYLHGTQVSDGGVDKLRETLPECRIRH